MSESNKPLQTSGRRSMAPSFAKSTLAMAVSGALMTQLAIAADGDQAIELNKLEVKEELTPDTNPYAVPGAPYLAERLSDPRRTQPLAETPQTITVLTATAIEESGRSDMREILDGQPGITLGTGENGNAFGDRYVIRGHEARSDMFVDGLRDPGMTIRETFAIEQLEISKGPSSTFAGRGTTGGAVNSVSKRASTEYDFAKISGGVGTDSHHRVTVDLNQVIGYDTAVRLNLLHAEEDVPDRSPANRERKGAAISLFQQFTDNFEMNFDYYHFEGDDKPDLGTYLTDSDGDGNTNNPVEDIPVYLQDEDFLTSTVDTFTVRAGLELSPSSRVVNLARYGTTDNGYVVTGTRGGTAYATEDDALTSVNGFETATLSTHQGWQEVEYFANQLNFINELDIGGMEHSLVVGTEYSNSKVVNGVYTTTATNGNCWTAGRGGVGEGQCIYDQNGNEVDDINNLAQRSISKGDSDSKWNLDTLSLYVMDSVELTDQWTVFGGVRYDHYDYELKTSGNGGDNTYEYNEGDWNGHLGASYEFTPGANIYASISSATNLNGGESDVGTNGGYGGFIDAGDADVGPERTTSYELGTKWKLNNGKMLATAALFRIDKSDVMEAQRGGDYSTTGTANTGANRVTGVEFGLAGNITDKLSAQAGVTIMQSQVTKSENADNVGKPLANFAENSFSVQTKYQATPKFAFGGTMTYESKRHTGQPDSAAAESMYVPGYTVFDAFAVYNVNRDLKVRLNINNLFDKDYYLAAYRSGAFTYIGDKRNANLTVEYQF